MNRKEPKMPQLIRPDFINGGWSGYRRRALRELARAEKIGCIQYRPRQHQCMFLHIGTLPVLCRCGGLDIALNILSHCPWPDVPPEVREGVDRHFEREMRWGQEWGK